MLEKLSKENKSQDKKHQFSLIIPTWNNLPYLQLCLKSIVKYSSLKHQIIILINEGNDGTLDWVKSQDYLDYVHSPENIGICYGLNVCRSLVNTDYIVYINDDMVVLPNWDGELFSQVKTIKNNNFILSSTMIEPYETNNACVIVKNYGDSLETFKENELLAEFQSFEKEDWFGSTWPPLLMHRDLWDLVGGMSIEFSPGMYSDPDLSMKLWKAGVRYFKGVGSSRVYHFGSKSTGRVKKNTGRDTFLIKWGVTSKFFTKKRLRRGEVFTGYLKGYSMSTSEKVINKIKRMLVSFGRVD